MLCTYELLCIAAIMLLIRTDLAIAGNATYCYSGSSLYQSVIVDCKAEDASYTGNWYCSQIEVCESFKSDNRECIRSKGCAKEEQCTCTSNCVATDDTVTPKTYGGAITSSTSQKIGGYDINVYCCKSAIFPDDDLVSINYDEICNQASSLSSLSCYTSYIIMGALTILFILSI